MAGCCSLSRRQLLAWGALVAATPLLAAAADPERAFALARGGSAGPVVPMNLELVTLTETSAIVTWYTGDAGSTDEFGRLAPAPSDTEVLLGTSPASMKAVIHETRPTPYHYAELTGLEPGQTYFYIARSGGMAAAPSAFALGNPVGTSGPSTAIGAPFVFTTPQPPAGKHLFTIALCNDLHLGEKTAGLITSQPVVGGLPPGFQQVPGEPPYPEVMAQALVTDARFRRADLLLAAGDLTSEAAPVDLRNARSLLDGFGTYRTDYLVTRGNHDRSHAGTAYAACSPGIGADTHDCFKDAFFAPGQPTWFLAEAFGLRMLGLDTYDKAGSGGDNGSLSPAQWDFVTRSLAADKERPTLVFGHHPISLESSATTAEPLIFDLDLQQGRKLEATYAATPGVFLHHSGHTHRTRRTIGTTATGVAFQEVCATKEYPGGFMLLRVHEGGYALNFYKMRGELAKEWSERTRQEDFGGYPYYTFGNVRDRNSVVARDFSGLTAHRDATAPARPTHAPDTQYVPTAGSGRLPATGPGLALPVAGLAAAAAAAGLRRAGTPA